MKNGEKRKVYREEHSSHMCENQIKYMVEEWGVSGKMTFACKSFMRGSHMWTWVGAMDLKLEEMLMRLVIKWVS